MAAGVSRLSDVVKAQDRQRPPDESREVAKATKLDSWIDAVEHHQPGQLDSAVVEISSWSVREFIEAREEWRRRTRLMKSEESPATTRVLERGALLHADIAMLFRDQDGYRNLPRTGAEALQVDDGQQKGSFTGTAHWTFGRLLLDEIKAPGGGGPASSQAAVRWYRATSVFLAEWKEWSELYPHLTQGLRPFPDDPGLLVSSALMHELFASPAIQAVLRTSRSQGFGNAIGSATDELKIAEKQYRHALDRAPSLVEARVRLARVLGLRDQDEESLAVLAPVFSGSAPPKFRYFALMIQGRASQALNRLGAARVAFEEAASLFPLAQSPRLALSQLGWAGALPRDTADSAMLEVVSGSDRDITRLDPWWRYLHEHERTSLELMTELRQSFQDDVRR